MKILHAADLHIDSPLGGLTAYEGAPVDEIRGATRRATENLVKSAIDHDVDLVVLAGDIFDGDWPVSLQETPSGSSNPSFPMIQRT